MTIRVIADGQIVHRLVGTASIGSDKTVRLGYATVEPAGTTIEDDEVSEDFLALVKDGQVTGVEYYSSEDDGPDEPEPVPASPEAVPPQNDQSLNPAHDEPEQRQEADERAGAGSDGEPGSGQEPTYSDDPDYEPDRYNQPQVLEYLKGASPEEVERVKAVEAHGQNRQQIAAFEPVTED